MSYEIGLLMPYYVGYRKIKNEKKCTECNQPLKITTTDPVWIIGLYIPENREKDRILCFKCLEKDSSKVYFNSVDTEDFWRPTITKKEINKELPIFMGKKELKMAKKKEVKKEEVTLTPAENEKISKFKVEECPEYDEFKKSIANRCMTCNKKSETGEEAMAYIYIKEQQDYIFIGLLCKEESCQTMYLLSNAHKDPEKILEETLKNISDYEKSLEEEAAKQHEEAPKEEAAKQ